MEIEFYKNSQGKEYVKDFIYSQNKIVARKILEELEIVESSTQIDLIKSKTIKKVKKPICEIRIMTISGGYRFLYAIYKEKAYLLEAFRKTTQKTPKKFIETALKRYFDLINRKP